MDHSPNDGTGSASVIATTSRRASRRLCVEARRWARRLGVEYVSRGDMSLHDIVNEAGARGALVVTAERIAYEEPATGVEYFFHPNMARLRIHNIRIGHGDPLITAMALREGDEVLDCTLGRATDAIVAGWVVGDAGMVLGLEKAPVIAQLAIHGLETYAEKSREVAAAISRVRALQADHRIFLPERPADSFDVVYFDPVFDRPIDTSHAMRPLREIGADDAVTPETLTQAKRVARRRVVVKQRRGTPLWEELPPDEIICGKKSRIEYGVFWADG